MRVLFAAVFVFGAMLGVVGLLDSHHPDGRWPSWATFAPAVVLFLALFVSLYVFNRAGFRPSLRRMSLQERIADLDRRDLLLRQRFRAERAFTVEEFEDEGPHYFIGLTSGNVLYLNGQYLYDYEPIDDDPEVNQPRSFPCSEFEVLRHKTAGYVLQIACGGQVLEPEVTAAAFSRDVLRSGIPEDGQVLKGESYESLKRRYASA